MSSLYPGRRGARDLQPRWFERLAQSVRRHRRGGRRWRLARKTAAIGLLVLAGVLALRPAPGTDSGQPVVMLARDLPAGAVLTADDVRVGRSTSAPDGVIADPAGLTGRALSSPGRRGEVLTDVRIVPPGGPAAGPGRVAVPVRMTAEGPAALLKPGMHVAVLSVDDAGAAERITPDAIVLAVPQPVDAGRGPPTTTRLVVLGVTSRDADSLAAAAARAEIAVRFT